MNYHLFNGKSDICPKCGGKLGIKLSKFGAFIGCSNLNSVVFQGGKLPKIGQSVFMKDVRLVCDEKEFADVSKHVFFCPSRTK